jgi:hypothetical protein
MTKPLRDFHEFLLWFDGYCENIEAAPTDKQWARIKAAVDSIREPAAAQPPAPTGIPNPPPAADPGMLKRLADLKAAGKSAAAPGGQAMSAGV